MTFRPLRATTGSQQRLADAFHGLNLGIRRIIALFVAAAIICGMVLVNVVGSTDFAHARDAVRTEEHKTAILVDIIPQGRYDEDFIVIAGGKEQKLDYGWFLPEDRIGSWVEYVVDQRTHLI